MVVMMLQVQAKVRNYNNVTVIIVIGVFHVSFGGHVQLYMYK